MHKDAGQAAIVKEFARRRRLAYAGLCLVVLEIVVVLVLNQLESAFTGPWLWALLVAPALGYLLLLWRICRCPACGTLLVLDAGPYQRFVFNLNTKTCPGCGISLA